MRAPIRSSFTIILALFAILTTFLSFHFYEKAKRYDRSRERFLNSPVIHVDSPLAIPLGTERVIEKVNRPIPSASKSIENSFVHYANDEHLRSLLEKQSNSLGQVIITIIGGDSYSLFAWDWHERMLAISDDKSNCHCFLIAMDEISVILAVQQNVPVYYSTFSFEQQMNWINVGEARQHSLYRVGYAKFGATAKIIQMGYSVMLSEMDVFWNFNPLDYLRNASEHFDLQISHHYGSHPRVNIGLFYVQSSKASIEFFTNVAEFWLRYGKGAYLSDQRVLDALLNNYDRLDETYLRAMKPTLPPKFNWTRHDFGNHFAHLMTDGSAFILFQQAAKSGKRSQTFYGGKYPKFFTVNVTDTNMSVSDRNLLIRSLLILQRTHLQNRTLIFPSFAPNITVMPITFQLDIKKFLLYWSEKYIRFPEFFFYDKVQSIPKPTLSFTAGKNYDDVAGILQFTIESIPLDLAAPSAQFDVHVRDSLLWCSPPMTGGVWCTHHPRDYGATLELLFACRGDPYPPCANKTAQNEQFLKRPYEQRKIIN